MKIALTVLASLALASGAQAKENGKDHAPGQLKKQPPAEVQAPVQQKVAPQAQSSPPGHTPNANPGGQKQGEKYPTPNGGRGIPGCGPSDSQPKKLSLIHI